MSKAKDEPIRWIVCGRVIGTGTGWDQTDTFDMQIYGFVPGVGYQGPQSPDGTINISFERGLVQTFNDNGEQIGEMDLIASISACPEDHIV